jgi:PKD repeat protein
MYYASVRVINGAGLITSIVSSDGQQLQVPTSPPIANFSFSTSVICEGDSIQLTNLSTDATSWEWQNGNGVWSTAQSPYLVPIVSGIYDITLIATNSAGNDTLTQSVSITVEQGPVASAIPDQTQLTLPNAIVLFTNTSQNADTYYWDFGDGVSTQDSDPWHQYASTGTYTVMLIASRTGCHSDTTYFTITVGQASLSELSQSLVTVTPNPFGSEFVLKGNQLGECVLFDVRGRKVWSGHGNNSDEFKISNLQVNAGVYLLKVVLKTGVTTMRIVKE